MFRSGAAPGQTLAEGTDLGGAERAATWPRAANGSWLDDKEPLVAAWTKSALAASERVRRGVGRGTHPTRTDYASLPGAAATGGANSPERRRGCLSALASVVHRIFTAIATRARQVSETV